MTLSFYSGKVAAKFEKSLSEDLDLSYMLFGPHARLSDADFGITFKGRPKPR